jgi:cytochrome oxidase assembly protein ShyY1
MKNGRLPLLPTFVVAAAILVMIGLGVWQLQRRGEKEAMLALAGANPAKPPISFPSMPPVPAEMLFRRSSLHCLNVVGWRTEAGRAADGSVGYRYIAQCSTGAEGPGALVALGVAKQPDLRPSWTGEGLDFGRARPQSAPWPTWRRCSSPTAHADCGASA